MSNLIKNILTSTFLFLIAIGGFFVNISPETIKINESYADLWAANDGNNSTPVVAASTKSNSEQSNEISKGLKGGIDMINDLLGIITILVSPAIIFASWLMSPDWTSGDLFGLREPMHQMWIIVSNIVYFIYAILLIIIALATIFGKDNFSYKTMLPKLFLGVLMVPFTWWFVQWTISLATVVTASVISIPMEALEKTVKGNQYLDKPVIPKGYLITNTDQQDATSKTESISADCSKESSYCISVREMLNSGGGMYSSLMLYAYDVFKLQQVKEITSTLDAIKTTGQLLNQLVIGAIMFLVFGLLVLALISILLLRTIKLWFYAIFSPIFTLHFVAGKELFGKGTDGFDIKEFIGLCFVPAVVGLTLSFGLMIVATVKTPDTPDKTSECTSAILETINYDEYANGKVSGGCTIMTLFGNANNKITQGIKKVTNNLGKEEAFTVTVVEAAGLTYVYHGKAKNNSEDIAKGIDNVRGGLDAGGGIFGTIIIDIIALIFIWMSFMAAKGISKAVDAAVQPFEAMGKKVGDMAMKMPQYAPIPGMGGMSVAGLGKTLDKVSSNIDAAHTDRIAKSRLGKLVGMEASPSPDTKNSVDRLKTYATRDAVEAAYTKIKTETPQNKIDLTNQAINNLAVNLGEVGKDGTWTSKKENDLITSITGFGINRDDAGKILKQIKQGKGSIPADYFKNDTEGSKIFNQIYQKNNTGGSDTKIDTKNNSKPETTTNTNTSTVNTPNQTNTSNTTSPQTSTISNTEGTIE